MNAYKVTMIWRLIGDHKDSRRHSFHNVSALSEDEARYIGGEEWGKANKSDFVRLAGLRAVVQPLSMVNN